jgi:sugar phosphate isomerase/epimerase
MMTRREWIKTSAVLASSLPFVAPFDALAARETRVRGVRMGLQSACFTFSGLALPDIITTMTKVGLGEIDIMSEHVEQFLGAPGIQLPGTGRPGPWTRPDPSGPAAGSSPSQASSSAPAAAAAAPPNRPFRGMDPAVRETLRQWRLAVDVKKYQEVARRFTDAGLTLFSYNLSFNDSYTDPEIEKGLLMARALGTRIITASSPLSVLPRVAPLAEKHDMIVALHNHMEGPEAFEQATALSRNIWINLDAGHFFAMGHDPVAYLRAHHARITNLHIKDRKSNRGREMPFGQGETPLKDLLTLVRDEKYDLPVCIEYVGPDGPEVELTRCFDYCKKLLAA